MEIPQYERVYVESDWYDGPLAGVADVGGVPHYFSAVPEGLDLPDRRYHVWPISPESFALEREAWEIFVRWNDRFEAGEAGLDTHPGIGGVDARYDELEQQLVSPRQAPDEAQVLTLDLRWREDSEESSRYRANGVTYAVSWRASP